MARILSGTETAARRCARRSPRMPRASCKTGVISARARHGPRGRRPGEPGIRPDEEPGRRGRRLPLPRSITLAGRLRSQEELLGVVDGLNADPRSTASSSSSRCPSRSTGPGHLRDRSARRTWTVPPRRTSAACIGDPRRAGAVHARWRGRAARCAADTTRPASGWSWSAARTSSATRSRCCCSAGPGRGCDRHGRAQPHAGPGRRDARGGDPRRRGRACRS